MQSTCHRYFAFDTEVLAASFKKRKNRIKKLKKAMFSAKITPTFFQTTGYISKFVTVMH